MGKPHNTSASDAKSSAKRQTLSKSLRFEVFKRDSFKCQYCGKAAPDVVLVIDHIHPISKDGDPKEITNLITACDSCNSGKSDRLLSDDAVAKKRKRQLDDLQERREQLEMMADWQRTLVDLDTEALNACVDLWQQIANCQVTEYGRNELRSLVQKFGQRLVMESMRAAVYYLKADGNGKITSESTNLAFSKIVAICVVKKREQDNPGETELYKMRARAKKNCGYFVDWDAIKLLRTADSVGVPRSVMWDICRECWNYSKFEQMLEEAIADHG